MKTFFRQLSFVLLVFVGVSATAATRYVDLNNPNPTPPYTTWITAATNIQDAITVATGGDEILVTNGVYRTGGTVVSPGLLTNRVAVTKSVTVRSVNGPGVTIIEGYRVPGTDLGTNAVRCVYLSNGAVLNGFTLTNGGTFTGGGNSTNYSGGGVRSESTNAMVLNCVLSGNAASDGGGTYSGTLSNCLILQNTATGGGGTYNSILRGCKIEGNRAGLFGGGAYGGTLANCTVANNSAVYGGGSYFATVINSAIYGNFAMSGGGLHSGSASNCTIVANSAGEGGGVFGSVRLRNSIIYYNQATASANVAGHLDLINCCITPASGVASIASDPQLANLSRLSSASLCRTNGSAAYSSGTDIDGEAWANPPSIGCDQYVVGSSTGALTAAIQVNFTNVAVGAAVRFLALIDGRVNVSRWEFGDGTMVSNRPVVFHKWTSPGTHEVVLRAFNETFPEGISATTSVQVVTQPIHYVRSSNPAQASPYKSWATAATSIQNAVDAASAVPGSLVMVSNGVYSTGTSQVWGTINRLVATNQVIVKSVNGPAVTHIVGRTPIGAQAIRCVYLGDGAVLDGFTLTNGATLDGSSDGIAQFRDAGGGAFCESSDSIITNCIVRDNLSGGIWGGDVSDCVIQSNSGFGVAAHMLSRSVITGNQGRGVHSSTTDNCLIALNSGGGAENSRLSHCTIVSNTANSWAGTLNCNLTNSIVQFNRPNAPGYDDVRFTTAGQYYVVNNSIGSLFDDWPADAVLIGNFATAPIFVNPATGDFRLQSNSPGINDGTNIYVTSATDLAGNPRIVGGAVDVGAYEHQSPAFQMPYRWLWQYGLAANNSSDSSDADGDGMGNYGEWRSGTIPTNAASALRMLTPAAGATGVAVSWRSVSLKKYWLERAEDLSLPMLFQIVATNIPGNGGTRTFIDTSATNAGPYFYRVGVH
jgi:hypothetical protein